MIVSRSRDKVIRVLLTTENGLLRQARLTEEDIEPTGRTRVVYTGEWYELLPLWQGVESMRRLVNLIIRDRTPRSPKTNHLYKEMLAQMDDSLNENPAKASRLAALQSSAESDERLDQLVTWDINKERGKDLLIAFWSAPDEWLSRLRRCNYLRCQRFFFDSSLDKYAAIPAVSLAAFSAAFLRSVTRTSHCLLGRLSAAMRGAELLAVASVKGRRASE